MNLKLAHISDLHFGVVTFHPRQFLSKRWLGNANFLLFRKPRYNNEHLKFLLPFLSHLKVDALSITGDFSSTSQESEFEKAAEFLRSLTLPTLCVPGNHDCYTKESERSGLFYRYFPEMQLEKNRLMTRRLNEKWHWIGLDCTLSTPLFHSYGLFTPELERKLEATLQTIPLSEKIVISCHWPINDFRGHRHDLKRKEALKELLLSFPQVKLYLHGHDHSPSICLEPQLTIVGGGSLARKNQAPLFILDLKEESIGIEQYHLKKKEWKRVDQRTVSLT